MREACSFLGLSVDLKLSIERLLTGPHRQRAARKFLMARDALILIVGNYPSHLHSPRIPDAHDSAARPFHRQLQSAVTYAIILSDARDDNCTSRLLSCVLVPAYHILAVVARCMAKL